MFDPADFALAGIQAGISQAEDSFPAYGQGASGYGKRYGAAFADQVSSGFFVNFVYPSLLKEDRVTIHLLVDGENLKTLIEEVGELVTHEKSLVSVLQQAYAECEDYAARCRPGRSSGKDENKRAKSKSADVK